MAYADYAYYSEIYKGTLSESDFQRLSERASDYIDGRTNYILKTADISEDMEERVRKACCALAEIIENINTGGIKTRETVGNYSVGYASGVKISPEKKLDDTMQLYLADLVKAVKWI
ncbi:MAG: hypothetical protein J1E40_07755 [Oscillospiraceae bacterium]|nr:hypothetical protein [Oscillospiraceae bacterium]